MKYIIIILLVLFSSVGFGQYNPALHNTASKAYGSSQAFGTDARSMYFDAVNFVYRAFVDTTEVWLYLNQAKYRTGAFPILVNTGGTLNSGVITGGTNRLWYYKDGTNRNNLVPLNNITSVNGQQGVVVIGNADSIRGKTVDTTVASGTKNNYLLTYDSTNNKWKLTAPASAYTAGTGISIASNVISALNTSALWNAVQIRSRSVTTSAPSVGQILKWSGTSIDWADDNSSLDTAYLSGYTLFLIGTNDTVTVPLNDIDIGNGNYNIRGDTTGSIHFQIEQTGTDKRNVIDINVDSISIASNNIHYTQIISKPDSLKLIYNNNATGRKFIKIDTTAITVADPLSGLGMIYEDDYSTNGKANPRWIPDIAAVRNVISDSIATAGNANNGLSKSGSNIVLGQNFGDGSNPAILTGQREIPTNNAFVHFTAPGISASLDTKIGANGVIGAGDYTSDITPQVSLVDVDGSAFSLKKNATSTGGIGEYQLRLDNSGNKGIVNFHPSGNVSVSQSDTHTDDGYDFQVQGATSLQDTVKLSKVSTGLSTDSVLVRGTDGVVKKVAQNSVGNTITNTSTTGDTLFINNQIKRLQAGYGIINTPSATGVNQKVDTATLFPAVRATIPPTIFPAINKSITFGVGVNTSTYDTSKIKFDSAANGHTYLNVNAPSFTPGIIVGFGNSITVGVGATPQATNNWLSQTAYALGCTVNNQGLTSSLLENQIPSNPFGVASGEARAASALPTYTPSYAYLIISYGVNDVRYVSPNYNVTNFATAYQSVINTATGKGWPISKIKMLSTSYLDSALSFANFSGTGIATYARQNSFDSTIQAVAAANGIQYINIRTPMQQNGGASLLTDGTHPTNQGYQIIAKTILQNIDTVRINNQRLAINGQVELKQLKYNSTPVLSNTALPVGVDSAGNIGYASTINAYGKGLFGNATDDGITPNKLIVNGAAKTYGIYINSPTFAGVSLPTTGLIVQYYSNFGFSTLYNGANDRMFLQQGNGGLTINGAGTINDGNKTLINNNTEITEGIFRCLNINTPVNYTSGTGLKMFMTGSKGYLATDGNLPMSLNDKGQSSGFVGIGTASPLQKLHIAGQVAIDTLANGTPGTDSVVVVNGGVLKKVAASNFSSGYTFSTGLTNSSGTITNNLSTGISGGQTIFGGTASGNNLTLSSTTNGTKGKIILGSASAYDEVNDRLGIGQTTPTAALHLKAGTTSASTAPLKFTSGTLNTTAEAGTHEYNDSHYETKGNSLRYATGGVIADFTTDAANSGTGETDLYSYTTPASTLANTGEKITFNFTVNLSDATATSIIKLYFAGVTIANSSSITISNPGVFYISGYIVRTGSTTARVGYTATCQTATVPAFSGSNDLTSLTFTNTNILKMTGQAGGGTGGSNDITAKSGFISWYGSAQN